MMNGGNFRMDAYIKAGPITFGVIENIITDKIVVKEVPGRILVEALENCVSMYPNLAGRYSAFSGISFKWDASKKPGSRVIVDSIHIHETEKFNLDKIYKVAMHSFAGDGGDGYECLKQCKLIENDNDRLNRQIVHDLLHINRYLLDTYIPKYPNRFKIIEKENHQYLELDLPEPKNVHMIMSTGHPFEQH
jgi:2',3'-cyclic-nucleotide 2'-phosphodiesterase (5'-nucleotidase family)